jgi:hypothetical protein
MSAKRKDRSLPLFAFPLPTPPRLQRRLLMRPGPPGPNVGRLRAFNLRESLMASFCRLIRLSALAGLLVLLSAGPGLAQAVTTSGLTGRIATPDGNPLQNVQIVVVNVATGTQQAVMSRADGRYNFPGLRPGGPYRVEARGWATGPSGGGSLPGPGPDRARRLRPGRSRRWRWRGSTSSATAPAPSSPGAAPEPGR